MSPKNLNKKEATTPSPKTKLEVAVAWAGIIAAILVLLSLVLQVIKPEARVITIVQRNIPYHAVFLFLFAVIALTYFLISRLLERIGDIHITGDVVTTKHIGDYVKSNIQGIDRSQLELIIDGLTKREDLKSTLDKMVDSLSDQQKLGMVERILQENPKLATSEHITTILETLRRKDTV